LNCTLVPTHGVVHGAHVRSDAYICRVFTCAISFADAHFKPVLQYQNAPVEVSGAVCFWRRDRDNSDYPIGGRRVGRQWQCRVVLMTGIPHGPGVLNLNRICAGRAHKYSFIAGRRRNEFV